MPNVHSLLDKINSLRMGKRYGQYAPHKPLLLLHALGELSRGYETVSFRDLDAPLTRLLEDFWATESATSSRVSFLEIAE